MALLTRAQSLAIRESILKTGTYKDRLQDLLKETALEYNESVETLISRSHLRRLVTVRRVFCKKARALGYSYPKIARTINRHHTDVLHLVRT